MTSRELTTFTCKELATIARDRGLTGVSSLRKDELVSAIMADYRKSQRKMKANQSGNSGFARRNLPNDSTGRSPKQPDAPRSRIAEDHPSRQLVHAHQESDSVLLELKNPFWMQAGWSVTSRTMARAEAALGEEWSQASLVLRLFEVSESDSVGRSRSKICDVEIYGNVDHWFLQVAHPGRSYNVQLGLVVPSGKFFQLACSKTIHTPKVGSKGDLRRTELPVNLSTESANGKRNSDGASSFPFELDAKLVVSGIAEAGSKISAMDESVEVHEDGTFTVTYQLPNGRQVIPFVSINKESGQRHTKIIALERNTKTLEVAERDEL